MPKAGSQISPRRVIISEHPVVASSPGMNIRSPLPLRPDREALAELALSSLVRACITTAHAKLNPDTRVRDFAQQRLGSDEARSRRRRAPGKWSH
jgi:hypothetical protein